MNEERYRIVLAQSGNVIFEYHFIDKTVFYSDNFWTMFGWKPSADNFIEDILANGTVYEEDRLTLRNLFERTMQGEENVCGEVRINKADGHFLWCVVHISTIFDDAQKPYKLIGNITDIDRQKKETDCLLTRANSDPLTGIYNKTITQKLIEEYLAGEGATEKHALLVVDIDDFKGVNDNLGHMFGDVVLMEISTKIKNLFCGTEIVGRMGGDEFMIFIKNIENEEVVVQKVKAVCELFRKTYAGERQEYKISGSVGVAIYGKSSKNYQELYKNADTALYVAKNNGKDQYAFYSTDEWQMQNAKDYVAVEGAIDQTAASEWPVKSTMRSYIFEVLYKAKSIQSSISVILELLGEYFMVSRAHIDELDDRSNCCRSTYEWHRSDATPKAGQCQDLSAEQFQGLIQLFDQSGVFNCPDVRLLEPTLAAFWLNQGIQSTLQVTIEEQGEIRGFIGFDDCSRVRVWTEDEVALLTFICRIIGAFILKKQVSDKLAASLENQKLTLDNMENFIFVIDEDRYELLYINEKTLTILPEAQVGGKCYATFEKGQMMSCENCPLEGLKHGEKICSREIYHQTLCKWMKMTACRIPWPGTERAVLTCYHDIPEPEN